MFLDGLALTDRSPGERDQHNDVTSADLPITSGLVVGAIWRIATDLLWVASTRRAAVAADVRYRAILNAVAGSLHWQGYPAGGHADKRLIPPPRL